MLTNSDTSFRGADKMVTSSRQGSGAASTQMLDAKAPLGLKILANPKALPVAALALMALTPLRMVSLATHWDEIAPPAMAAPAPKLAEQLPDISHPPVDTGRTVVALREGVIATQTISDTLAGGARSAPVGDDRPADGKLLAEVARRQAELDKRQHDLESRSAQVEAASTLARQQIAELTRLRGEIEGLVSHETGAADADLNMLVGMYQNMKPPQAAAVLGKMEPQRASLILQKMGDRAGGPILAAMDPNAALAISEDIAQRRSAFRVH